MCMFKTPTPPAAQVAATEPVVERSEAALPDGATAKSAAGRRTADRVRSGANTILTGAGAGLTPADDQVKTQGKTLLGA